MTNLQDMSWNDSIKAKRVVNGCFDEYYGTSTLELTDEDMVDLIKGEILQVVVESEYTVLIRLKGEHDV